MTTQALPPSLDQQIADARTATAVAEQKSAHWQGVADKQRQELDHVYAALTGLTLIKIERDTLVRQLAELTQLVGAETPIAAFTLAETWTAEKASYQEEIADLKEQRADLLWRARAVYRYVKTYKTTHDGDEARMAVGEGLWAAGATDPDKREP